MTYSRTRFESELELVNLLSEYLQNEGYIFATEVPNLGCSVDVAARRDDRLILFEAKLHNWRRALKQAEIHLFVADYVFIIMPIKEFSQELYREAKAKRIGVIFVEAGSSRWSMRVKPRISDRIWIPQRQQFQRHMDQVLNAY